MCFVGFKGCCRCLRYLVLDDLLSDEHDLDTWLTGKDARTDDSRLSASAAQFSDAAVGFVGFTTTGAQPYALNPKNLEGEPPEFPPQNFNSNLLSL